MRKGFITKLTVVMLTLVTLVFSGCGGNPDSGKGPPEDIPTSIVLNKSQLELKVGETYKLLVSQASYFDLDFVSSHTDVASVDSSGNILAKAIGETTITVSDENKDLSATCVVNVVEQAPVYNLSLDRVSAEIGVGSMLELTPSYTVNGAPTSGSVEWSYTVEAGEGEYTDFIEIVTETPFKLTAKAVGTVRITATVGNCSADCLLTIINSATDDDYEGDQAISLEEAFSKKGTNFINNSLVSLFTSDDANISPDANGFRITSKFNTVATVKIDKYLFSKAVEKGYESFSIKGVQYDVSTNLERANWWTVNVNSVEKYASQSSAEINLIYNINDLLQNGSDYFDLVIGIGNLGGHYAYLTELKFINPYDGLDDASTNWANGKYLSLWDSNAEIRSKGEYLESQFSWDKQANPNFIINKELLAKAEAKGYTSLTFTTVSMAEYEETTATFWWSVTKDGTEISGSAKEGAGITKTYNLSDLKNGNEFATIVITSANAGWNRGYLTSFTFANAYGGLSDETTNWASEAHAVLWSSADANILPDATGLKLTSKSNTTATVTLDKELFKRAVAQGYTTFTVKGTQYDVSNDSERANWWTVNVNGVEKYSSSASAKIDKTYNIDELLKNGDEYYDLVVGIGNLGGHYGYITELTFSK